MCPHKQWGVPSEEITSHTDQSPLPATPPLWETKLLLKSDPARSGLRNRVEKWGGATSIPLRTSDGPDEKF